MKNYVLILFVILMFGSPVVLGDEAAKNEAEERGAEILRMCNASDDFMKCAESEGFSCKEHSFCEHRIDICELRWTHGLTVQLESAGGENRWKSWVHDHYK